MSAAGYRRVDRRVPDVRVRRAAGVRTGQLRQSLGHAPRQHPEAAARRRDGARQPAGRFRRPDGGRRQHLRHGRYISASTTFTNIQPDLFGNKSQ